MMAKICWLFIVMFVNIQHGILAQSCNVNELNVHTNFDFAKYMGKWYVISWYSDITVPSGSSLTDYTQHYIRTDEGSSSVYTQGREIQEPRQCQSAVYTFSTTDTPGKLNHTFHGVTSPYWVLETNYSAYAFVYGCNDVSSSGTCNAATAWILSRTPTLAQNVKERASTFYENICIEGTAFTEVTFSNECAIRTHWKLKNDQDCTVSDFDVQENFDINLYAGTWYEIKWLSSVVYPPSSLFQDYQHHYVITGDGNITGYISGRSPTTTKCFYGTSTLQQTNTPGRFTHYFYPEPSPYWVIRTDYIQYAVVYGCYNVISDGSCNKGRSWVWSRTPTLPPHLEYQANTILQNICVNPTAFLGTEQRELCPLNQVIPLDEQSDCNVTRFEVKKRFDVNRFSRLWYETRWLPKTRQSSSDLPSDRLEELHVNHEGDITSYIRYRKGDTCTYGSVVYKKTNTPGKFTAVLSSKESFNYWVADTDFENYAVMYGCDRVGLDGGCLSARGSVWSRKPSLDRQLQYQANSVLQGLCINPSALVTTSHAKACPPEVVEKCTDVEVTGSSSRAYLSFQSIIGVFISMWPWLKETTLTGN